MTTGILGQSAPEFRFDNWIATTDPDGLAIADIDEPVIYLYNFQSWCPGCHSHGFPTMAAVKDHFERSGQAEMVRFVAVQTVFEGHATNTAEAALEAVERHGLSDIALGHDSGTPPTIMARLPRRRHPMDRHHRTRPNGAGQRISTRPPSRRRPHRAPPPTIQPTTPKS